MHSFYFFVFKDTVAIDSLINVWLCFLLLFLVVFCFHLFVCLFCARVIYHPGMISIIQLTKLF